LGNLKALGEREDRVAVVALIQFNELHCIQRRRWNVEKTNNVWRFAIPAVRDSLSVVNEPLLSYQTSEGSPAAQFVQRSTHQPKYRYCTLASAAICLGHSPELTGLSSRYRFMNHISLSPYRNWIAVVTASMARATSAQGGSRRNSIQLRTQHVVFAPSGQSDWYRLTSIRTIENHHGTGSAHFRLITEGFCFIESHRAISLIFFRSGWISCHETVCG
jgi:hypothetical protein